MPVCKRCKRLRGRDAMASEFCKNSERCFQKVSVQKKKESESLNQLNKYQWEGDKPPKKYITPIKEKAKNGD